MWRASCRSLERRIRDLTEWKPVAAAPFRTPLRVLTTKGAVLLLSRLSEEDPEAWSDDWYQDELVGFLPYRDWGGTSTEPVTYEGLPLVVQGWTPELPLPLVIDGRGYVDFEVAEQVVARAAQELDCLRQQVASASRQLREGQELLEAALKSQSRTLVEPVPPLAETPIPVDPLNEFVRDCAKFHEALLPDSQELREALAGAIWMLVVALQQMPLSKVPNGIAWKVSDYDVCISRPGVGGFPNMFMASESRARRASDLIRELLEDERIGDAEAELILSTLKVTS